MAEEASFVDDFSIDRIIAKPTSPSPIREVRKLVDQLNHYEYNGKSISLEEKAKAINSARHGIANNVSESINSCVEKALKEIKLKKYSYLK